MPGESITPKIEAKPPRIYTQEEIDKILAAPPEVSLPALVMLETCIRIGELQAVEVPRCFEGNHFVVWRTKNGKPRRIPASPVLRERLSTHIGPVFTLSSGTRYNAVASRLTGVRVRCHDFRRTGATRIWERTENLRLVQAILDHAKIETTMRYLGVRLKQMSAWDKELGDGISQPVDQPVGWRMHDQNGAIAGSSNS